MLGFQTWGDPGVALRSLCPAEINLSDLKADDSVLRGFDLHKDGFGLVFSKACGSDTLYLTVDDELPAWLCPQQTPYAIVNS